MHSKSNSFYKGSRLRSNQAFMKAQSIIVGRSGIQVLLQHTKASMKQYEQGIEDIGFSL